MKDYIDAWKKMFQYDGVATRKSFWVFVLFNILIVILLTLAGKYFLKSEIPVKVYNIAALLPMYMLGFRRLRDANLMPLLFLIPIVNLILAAMPTNKG